MKAIKDKIISDVWKKVLANVNDSVLIAFQSNVEFNIRRDMYIEIRDKISIAQYRSFIVAKQKKMNPQGRLQYNIQNKIREAISIDEKIWDRVCNQVDFDTRCRITFSLRDKISANMWHIIFLTRWVQRFFNKKEL